jgi:hypothetical protein
MKIFELPEDLSYNNGPIKDPGTYLKERRCKSWLCLVGEEFAKMENGMSFQQVQAATPYCINIVSDPPKILNLDLTQQHAKPLDEYKDWVRSSIKSLRKESNSVEGTDKS